MNSEAISHFTRNFKFIPVFKDKRYKVVIFTIPLLFYLFAHGEIDKLGI
jgi:hypothetical protein